MNAWQTTWTLVAKRPGLFCFCLLILLAGACRSTNNPAPGPVTGGNPATLPNGGVPNGRLIAMQPFHERNGGDEFNASGIVPLAEGRFLFCDNNSGQALYELSVNAQGQQAAPILSRPLQGLGLDAPDDLEAMTYADEGGRRFIFATSSLYLKKAKKNKPDKLTPSGLLRITPQADGSLRAENMPGFREWLLQQVPELAPAAQLEPDDGGLNIEGLAWDPQRRALLLGVRTPAPGGQPLVIPVQVKELAGTWATSNLTVSTPIRLALPATYGESGIRSLEYIPERKAFLLIAGKSISDSDAPFALYEWDGQTASGVKRLSLAFARKIKPEGLTSGTVGGKPVLLIVDDGGGFQIVPVESL